MAKFDFYITNLFTGKVEGTNDKAVAENLAQCEGFFVVDAGLGQQLTPSGCFDVDPVVVE
jgi:hypothetical protein